MRALDSSWETVDQTQDKEEVWRALWGVVLPWGLHAGGPGSAWGLRCSCLWADQGQGREEDGFSFGRLETGKAMKSGQAQCQLASTSATTVPLCPAGPGLHTHTTALFTSTALLLCEDVMGYSATLVPFSSFLRGFLFMAL